MSFVDYPARMLAFAAGDLRSVGSAVVAGDMPRHARQPAEPAVV